MCILYRESITDAVRNGVHPSEFVFQKSRAIVSDFCGIQTHEGELYSTRAPMIDSISSTMFFPVITSQKYRKSWSNRRKSRSDSGNHSWVWKKHQDISLLVNIIFVFMSKILISTIYRHFQTGSCNRCFRPDKRYPITFMGTNQVEVKFNN